MRSHAAAGMAALVFGVCVVGGCNSSLTGPDSASAPPEAVVVEILGMNGDRSFSPSPFVVPAGRPVVWHNSDFDTHRIVADAGGLDTGDIRPGRFSAPMAADDGGSYHCGIHPSMIGRLKRAE
jgi:plastocyanin